jgi:hypothetical protein
MKINREIFKKFLESPDWTDEKTLNIFDKMDEENNLSKEDLTKELKELKFKYDDLKAIASESLKNYDSSMKVIEDLKKKTKNLEKELKEKDEEIVRLNKCEDKKDLDKIKTDCLGNIKNILPPLKPRKLIKPVTDNNETKGKELMMIKENITMPESFTFEQSDNMKKDIIKNLEDFIVSNDNKQRCKQIIVLFCRHKIYFVKKIGNRKYDQLLNNVNKFKEEKDYDTIFWSFFNEMARNI